MTQTTQALREWALRTGFPEDANRVYLVTQQTRYWITNPTLFNGLGLRAEDIRPTYPMIAPSPEGRPISTARDLTALLHIEGEGIEIGALHNPSFVPNGAKIRYVDYVSLHEQEASYPYLKGNMEEQLIIDDGEKLEKIAESSLDFIVANHFLEHTRNPLGTVRIHLKKLKIGGKLLYPVPDKRYTFDSERPVTSFEHVVRDDKLGHEISDWSHYLEFAEFADKLTDRGAIERHAKVLQDMDNRIHFHVWDADAAREFFEKAQAYLENSFTIVSFAEAEPEVVVALTRVR